MPDLLVAHKLTVEGFAVARGVPFVAVEHTPEELVPGVKSDRVYRRRRRRVPADAPCSVDHIQEAWILFPEEKVPEALMDRRTYYVQSVDERPKSVSVAVGKRHLSSLRRCRADRSGIGAQLVNGCGSHLVKANRLAGMGATSAAWRSSRKSQN